MIIKKHENTYRGKLEPNGSNDREEFYRCELEKEIIQEQDQTNWTTILSSLIIAFLIVAVIFSQTQM